MELNLIALAIPVFFLLIGIEVAVARLQGRPELYRFNDAVTDLSCGIAHEVVGIFNKAIVFGIYTFVWAKFRVADLDGAVAWFVGIVGYDLAYYWWHRFTHVVNVGWATHVVHHQSEEYNLAVALRQSVTSWITGIPFYLPLALIGVNPLVYGISGAISLLYQFWIHTEVIDRLPAPVEAVMNTPSHHRVHHAINPQYLDKNYAGILIVWDRMFGTFEPEVEQPVYGTVKPLLSFDPIWAQFAYIKLLIDDTRAASTSAERVQVWLGAPGYRPAGLPPYPAPAPVQRATQAKYDPRAPVTVLGYVGLQFVPVALGLTAMELTEETTGLAALAAGGVLILWATWSWGALFERRGVGLGAELVRLVTTAIAVSVWAGSPGVTAAAGLWAAVSALWVLSFAGWLTAAPADEAVTSQA